jgi:hypothetical protein
MEVRSETIMFTEFIVVSFVFETIIVRSEERM